jgi:hypothetical protein
MNNNLPDNVSDRMIDEEFRGREVIGPFFVELMVGGAWDLWAECDDLAQVREEVEVLKAHGFSWRVTDETEASVAS